MRKTIAVILVSMCFLVGCTTKTADTEESKSELEKFLEKASSESNEKKKETTLRLAEYKYVIPTDYGQDVKDLVKQMEARFV